ncbi:HmuY family protein [Algoriphagus chordae]|uniref:Heme-binding HmuY-like protein n=1 Tax=Algoriphagus chordae TaxID=237019 RepID=A0A2W7RB57_9BACT|nr:HmuY family protein [Algoriphagus chordae]PZX58208.1 heme-binding HmuY-like protein [Algoriphagus chordae]
MKQVRILSFAALAAGMGLFSSCNDDDPKPVVIPPSESGLIEVDGGGSTYPNTAYIDLSTGEQTAIQRESWDLAFSSGSDFKVLINGTTGAMASSTGKTDISQVGADEIAAAEASGELILTFTNLEGILHVDDAANPLSNTAIAAISPTAGDNEVYLLNRGTSEATERPWKKIRITRNGTGYTLEHADADSDTFTSLEVSKNSEGNLVYVSFEDGIVEVEPAKTAWDIAWTAGTSSTPYPDATNGTLAYFFQDLVYNNIYGGVGAAQVLEADIAYADFTEEDVFSLSFETADRLVIGSSWRSGGGPPGTPAPAVKTDIYYVVKDADANIYKVRFLSLTKDGERGMPTFEYELVVEG